jgi:hypothetical protein
VRRRDREFARPVVRALEGGVSLAGGDGGDELERLRAGSAGLGVVHDERLAIVVGDREPLAAEFERSDLRMIDP